MKIDHVTNRQTAFCNNSQCVGLLDGRKPLYLRSADVVKEIWIVLQIPPSPPDHFSIRTAMDFEPLYLPILASYFTVSLSRLQR